MSNQLLEDNEYGVAITRPGNTVVYATATFEESDGDIYVTCVRDDETGLEVETTWQERHEMIKTFRKEIARRQNDRY